MVIPPILYYKYSQHTLLINFLHTLQLIKANRTILAMNSPVFEFETQFFGTDVPQPQPILIPDMQPETFKQFLK